MLIDGPGRDLNVRRVGRVGRVGRLDPVTTPR